MCIRRLAEGGVYLALAGKCQMPCHRLRGLRTRMSLSRGCQKLSFQVAGAF